jgi:hypothetical protein
LQAIDELKGIAIIIVILSHARSVLPALAETLRGEVGVDIFLALSGFLLAFSSTNESAGAFLRKKAWRILPAYWIALIVFVTVKALTLGAAHIESIGLHLFALQLFASPEYIYDINRSFWFVSFIALAYLIFLAVRKHVERTGLMLIACGALTQRLGERGALLWALATGRDRRPLDTATPPSRYFASYELEHAVETLEPLLFLLRRFVDRLAAEVTAAGLATASLRLGLRFEDETTHERDFRLPQPDSRPDALFCVLEQHLATLHTAASVNRLELELFPAAASVRQDGLFEASLRDPHQFYDTLARVAALLGPERIGTPCNANTHRPDAVTLGPPPAVIPEYHPAPNPPAFGPLLRRFRPPHSALVECAEETPVALVCPSVQQAQGRIVQTRGPWRRSGEWWETDAAWAHEEWDVELDRGGLYRLTRTRDGWWLEGIYD